MQPKTYFISTLILFTIVVGVHLLRIINGWGAEIGGYTIPMWLSWVAVVIIGGLMVSSYRLLAKQK